jgi:hypothetical protein
MTKAQDKKKEKKKKKRGNALNIKQQVDTNLSSYEIKNGQELKEYRVSIKKIKSQDFFYKNNENKRSFNYILLLLLLIFFFWRVLSDH